MAAWVARVDSVTANGEQGVTVGVSYFLATDTGFTNPLATHSFAFVPFVTLPEMSAAVKDYGLRVRNGQDTVSALQPRINTTINIP